MVGSAASDFQDHIRKPLVANLLAIECALLCHSLRKTLYFELEIPSVKKLPFFGKKRLRLFAPGPRYALTEAAKMVAR